MILYEELYFEITLTGAKSELKKMTRFLNSGELDEFFEITNEYISYADEYYDIDDSEESEMVFSNDDLGIEIDEFDTNEFLEVFCKAGKNLYISGLLYDSSDEEYAFTSEAGDPYYLNARGSKKFNDELDEAADSEEDDDENEEDI